MSALKLTKGELRQQQVRRAQFNRYLPTLQLKKALLQYEINHVHHEVSLLLEEFARDRKRVEPFSALLLEKNAIDLELFAEIQHVQKRYENVAGIEIPIFEKLIFKEPDYFLFESPVWAESAIELVRQLITTREKVLVAQEKMRALTKELRAVSIRVNLFEKILIPRAIENIRKIRIFLSDQQLTAVAQAKVAKSKILAHRTKR